MFENSAMTFVNAKYLLYDTIILVYILNVFSKHWSHLLLFTCAYCFPGRVSHRVLCKPSHLSRDETNWRLSPLCPYPSHLHRFLAGGAGVVCGLVSHGPQGGRAGDAPRVRHGAPHPAAPAITPHSILPAAPQLLLPTATAPAHPGRVFIILILQL